MKQLWKRLFFIIFVLLLVSVVLFIFTDTAQDQVRRWTRPAGPPRVGLQVGHLHIDQLPESLAVLRKSTGASGGGKTEAEVNYEIAKRTKLLLEEKGIIVDLIPATPPSYYRADVFVSIHADGFDDKKRTGYKAAGPWNDYSGSGDELLAAVEKSYEQTTKLRKDPHITDDMRGYYSFSWWRDEYSVHPLTPAIILETGYLSNENDQKLLIENPDIPANGLSEGIIAYLEQENLLHKK